MGLAGLGDLVLTCTGDLSRNREVGVRLAAGKPLATILAELGHVAEGVPTARSVSAHAQRLGVEMPIVEAVCAVLEGRQAPAEAVAQLMARDPRSVRLLDVAERSTVRPESASEATIVYCPGGRPLRSSCPLSTPPPAGTCTGVSAVVMSALPPESATRRPRVPVSSLGA